jgi:hypothetical protein
MFSGSALEQEYLFLVQKSAEHGLRSIPQASSVSAEHYTRFFPFVKRFLKRPPSCRKNRRSLFLSAPADPFVLLSHREMHGGCGVTFFSGNAVVKTLLFGGFCFNIS